MANMFQSDLDEYKKMLQGEETPTTIPGSVVPIESPKISLFQQDLSGMGDIASSVSNMVAIKRNAEIEKQKRDEQKADEEELGIAIQAYKGTKTNYTPEELAQAQTTQAGKMVGGQQDKILSKSGAITQRFGNINPIEVYSGGVNYGTDIGVDKGTKVALPPGKWKVVEAYNGAQEGQKAANRGYGNSILVQNTETGEKLRFSHLSQVGIQQGAVVDGGNIVGATGNTGNSTGPHLDLEYYDNNGKVMDILNSPYSSFLGIGQGGGGTGGGKPDKKTIIGQQLFSPQDNSINNLFQTLFGEALSDPSFLLKAWIEERKKQDKMNQEMRDLYKMRENGGIMPYRNPVDMMPYNPKAKDYVKPKVTML